MYLFLFFLPFLLFFALYGVYAERKISAFIQSRMGPMEVGPFGLLQTVADIIKMLLKEDIVPKQADHRLFKIAPVIVFVSVFAGFALVPLSPDWYTGGLETGIILVMAVVSLDVLGIFLAGWSSNNKYSLYGAVRAIAQVVSYEIPLGLCVLSIGIWYQTFDLQTITLAQTSQSLVPVFLLGIPAPFLEVTSAGGFLTWTVFQNPLFMVMGLIFFIAGLAESNRAPFDLPETESEIIGGYHTEYSGFRWGIFMLAEYAMMFLMALLTVLLFFGGWASPFPDMGVVRLGSWTTGNFWGVFWLLSKTFAFVFIQMWVRWTFPRLRVDQLMTLAWKYLTPFSLLLVLFIGLWRLLLT